MPVLTYKTFMDHPAEEVFAWHMRPGALQRLSPPWESARILEQEGGISTGGRVTLGVKRGPTEITFVVEHTDFEPGRAFTTEQVSGPFSAWKHRHRFEPCDGGCHVIDTVEWEVPMGAAGRLFVGWSVEGELNRLFLWRHERIRGDLSRMRRYGSDPELTVAVTGASGLVGQALLQLLRTQGHKVIPLVRDTNLAPEGSALWNPDTGLVERDKLEGIDAMVHLAGEPIMGFRWSDEKKRAIKESRTKGTDLISRTIAAMSSPPEVLISASAMGIYGDRGNEILSENSKVGKGFLAGVCKVWEAATEPAQRAGIRVANLRIGMVLSPLGGALGTMLLPFKIGIGGRLGSGRQYVSWIDVDDLAALILHVIRTKSLSGPVNATAPYPVPNSTFSATLGRVLGRPTLVPIPGFAVKALFGEMGSEVLLSGARIQPEKCMKSGFEFQFPAVEDSLRFQLGKPSE
jgi:uncharacterized protein